ncbi:nucleic acid-binding protein [Microthyrium microscopicum]|uniref:Nucleic acid-binding protein n=1 Tax=Microthyrium microscopicum TaxID=703497 RepID=A0A6A6ULN0_9PEZI|nr:nucleic acid-binding protein [Microthyrium microscopicum]
MPSRPKRTVLADATASASPPTTLEPNHVLAQVVKAQGNSLFTVTLPDGEILLVELPSKLRNTFWIKRRGYVVIDTQEFAERDNKLGGLVVTVVMDEKRWRRMAYWPKEFGKTVYEASDSDEEEEESNMGKMPPSSDDEE